nr:replication protein A 70 kDa DNA-binding subunit-like [Ipomoea batatas]
MPSQYVSLKDLSPMHRNRAIRVRLVRTYQIPELRGGQTSEVRITSSYDATKLHCNESFAEFLEFKSKLVSGQSPVRSISTATVLSKLEGIGDFTSDSKMVTTISDLLDQKENGDFYVPAESLGIEGSGEWYYISCMSPGCTVRYKVVVRVVDKTGNAPFLLWDREVVEIVGIPTAVLFEKFHKESAIPPELESLIGMEQLRGPTSAFNVMRVLRDEELVSTYCTSFNDQPEKDLMSMLIEEDEDDEESDLEASWEDEVNSPGNARQMENNFTESEDCDTVKRYLMDEYSSSNKFKKAMFASIKQEKL